MQNNFYRAFEDKFRGQRKDIIGKLYSYSNFLEPLSKIYPNSNALDLGCGRGEWLEVAKSFGFDAKGVDLDDEMLDGARAFKLNVENIDAIAYIKSLPSDSHSLITGFHIAEHLQFETLLELINESKRVLMSGGLLILETPNPENIRVATYNFYLDPTHTKPIPQELLQFMVENCGFMSTKIVRSALEEDIDFNIVTLLQVIQRASNDYALVAQKYCEKDIADVFLNAFSKEYGASFEKLSIDFESRIQKILHALAVVEEKAWKATIRADEAEEKAWKATIRADEAVELARQSDEKAWKAAIRADEAVELARQSDEKAWYATVKSEETAISAHNAWLEYYSVVNSRSWKITKPLRKLGSFARALLKKKQLQDSLESEGVPMQSDEKFDNLSPNAKQIYTKIKRIKK